MLAKTGLLIVSNPQQIGKILPAVQERVKSTLYIQLLSALTEPFGNVHTNIFNSWPKYSPTIRRIYSQATTHCQNLDVRVLLSGLKYSNLTQIHTKSDIDLVIFDTNHKKSDVDSFITTKIGNIAKEYNVVTLDSGPFVLDSPELPNNDKVYSHTVLGGTFDRLHVAHKLLLTEAVLRSENKVTVGVTEESMLKGKILWELIEDLNIRIENVRHFLEDICAELSYDVVPISDPFGPSIVDPTMGMIVVSEETLRGGNKINEIRQQEKNLNKLDIVEVKLIDEPHNNANEETKISSSTTRIRLLGTLLKPIEKKSIDDKPYVIGLTGGVASGKSSVGKHLSELGAKLINCDLIAHGVYKQGKPCYTRVVEHFGNSILTPQGEIDRKVLGSIVFKNPDELKNLNSLVWPSIIEEVINIIKTSEERIIIVEAAVLLMAGWEKYCHEVWTTFVPREEAIKRLVSRNGLTEEQAISRIDSQPLNKIYTDAANVVFSTLWEVEFTRKQVQKAWDSLQARLL